MNARTLQANKSTSTSSERKRKLVAEYSFIVEGTELDGRAALIKKYARTGSEVKFELDTQNRRQPNAVKVLIGEGIDIGYVKEYDKDDSPLAKNVARYIRREFEYEAKIEKINEGKKSLIPVVKVRFYGDAAELADQADSAKGKNSRSTLLKVINWGVVASIILGGSYAIVRYI